jgi:hypothetical protein
MDNAHRNSILQQRMAGQGTAPAPKQANPARRQVVNMHWFKGQSLPADIYYVGRVSKGNPGPYGNPYEIGKHGTLDEVCDKFEADFRERVKNPAYVAQMMRDLDGKHLACWCAQRGRAFRCHAQTIMREVAQRSARPELYCD